MLTTGGYHIVVLTLVACMYNFCQYAEAADSDAKNDSVLAILEVPNETDLRVKGLRRRLAPKCKNFLTTVLHGRWVPKEIPYGVGYLKQRAIQRQLKRKENQLDKDMRFVWEKRGIPPDPWSSTTLCGYYRLRKPTPLRPSIGTWCDPNGPKPCCNNLLYGKCVAANVGECTCSKCVDVRKMKHAELMEWRPYSYRCQYHQYRPSQACNVLEVSPVKELYIVGDSFMQNMYISLLMVLSGKPVIGSWTKNPMTADQKLKCSNYGLTYFKECRAMIWSLDDMLYRNSLCGNGRNVTFKAEYKKYYSSKFGTEFKELVRGLLGRNGAYVVVGIGFHVRLDLQKAIREFMKPAVQLVKNYYRGRPGIPMNRRWPQFLFSFPLDYSILKSTRHLKAQYITKQKVFEAGMTRYCKRNSIPILDFTPLTKNVLTFDGVHYGVGVNVAKAQILLNYFASLPNK